MGFKTLKNVGTGFLAGVITVLCLTFALVLAVAPETFIMFLILKLVGVITFGWFYVFLPLIIMSTMIVIYFIILYCCGV